MGSLYFFCLYRIDATSKRSVFSTSVFILPKVVDTVAVSILYLMWRRLVKRMLFYVFSTSEKKGGVSEENGRYSCIIIQDNMDGCYSCILC